MEGSVGGARARAGQYRANVVAYFRRAGHGIAQLGKRQVPGCERGRRRRVWERRAASRGSLRRRGQRWARRRRGQRAEREGAILPQHFTEWESLDSVETGGGEEQSHG